MATLTALSLVAFVLLASTPARAQKPTSQTTEYSPYEKETIKRALESRNTEIEPNPEGKIIGKVETERLEVIEDRDPFPKELLGVKTMKLANSLHATTREWIVRRELLLKEGDVYTQVIIDEIARNIRGRMPVQISLVIIVPIKSKDPDKVDLLVITKDIWSLRLSYDMSITLGGLENLLIVPQETNLLGVHHTAQTRFQYQPETYSFGVGYRIPRFGTTWIGASAAASITINRRSGEPEGSGMSLGVGQGLYSTRTEWAWSADASYSVGVARRYSNARVFLFDSPRTVTRDANGRLVPIPDDIPYQYKSRAYGASAAVTRSFGWGFKNNFSLSMNASKAEYETFDLSGFNAFAAQDFVSRALPTGEARVYPAISWNTFTTNFLRTLDINTLALQEDYRLGHDIAVSLYPVTRALGSSRDLVGVSARAGYALPMGDGLVGASVSTFAETCTSSKGGCEHDGRLSDAAVSGSFGAATPRIGFGRIVMNASFSNRYRNYLNARTFAGGDDRLRGYPSNYFFGKDTVFYNIEFRTTSVRIWTFALGGVAFYDAGDVAQGFDMLHAKQSVGLGARVLIPQVNRPVFRLDFALPLSQCSGGIFEFADRKCGPFPETGTSQRISGYGFFFAFDQAFTP